jgi:GR25 family glycosyltransferase involved in LPS biosynthesis
LIETCKQAVLIPPVFVDDQDATSFRQALVEFILNGRLLNAGERGCAQAHINVRENILTSKHDWVLVLEDDVAVPVDWEIRLSNYLDLGALMPSVVILNTDDYFNLGLELVELKLKPSLANAFLIHRKVLENRPYSSLERFEIADWPISFSGANFYSLSNFAFDTQKSSLIGSRPRSRVAFLTSILVRLLMLPLSAVVTAVPALVLARWSLAMPLKRDLALRWRFVRKAFATSISGLLTKTSNHESGKK